MASNALPTTPFRVRSTLTTRSELASATDTYGSSIYDEASESVDAVSQSIMASHISAVKSTPSVARSIKTTYQWESVNDRLTDDVEKYRSSGVSPSDFIRLAFGQSNEDYSKLEERCNNLVERLKGHADFDRNLRDFETATVKSNEVGMYEPLVNMGNMILENNEDEDEDASHEVRLWSMKEKQMVGGKGKLKPDLVLIPRVVRDRVSALQEEESLIIQEKQKEREERKGKKAGGDDKGKGKGKGKGRNVRKEYADEDEEDGQAVYGKEESARQEQVEKKRKEEEEEEEEEDSPSRVNVGEALAIFECKARPNSKKHGYATSIPTKSSVRQASAAMSETSTRSRSSNTSASRKRAVSPSPVSRTSSNKKPRLNKEGSGPTSGILKVRNNRRNTKPGTPLPEGSLQLARYMMHTLSARGDRKFALGVRLNAHQMSFSFYSRTNIVEATAFDLCTNLKYFAMFLLMFQRHPTTYGFNSITGYSDPFNLENEETKKIDIADVLDPKYSALDKSVFRNLKLEGNLSSEFCLIGRGSTVFKVSAPEEKDASTMVVKFSWQESSRPHEIENIQYAREILNKRNVVEAYGYADLKNDSPGEALHEACTKQGHYKEKRLRILVMKYYHTLSKVEDPDKFCKLIVQLIESLHLLSIGGMLHRDISIGNLAFEEVNGELSIIILDFELAVKLDHNGIGTNSVRTGTAPFMAREVLDGFKTEYTHGISHDLESVFYVLVWHAVGYRGLKVPDKDPLRSWRKGNYKTMREAKDAFLDDWSFVESFITEVKFRNLIEGLHVIYAITSTDKARRKNAIMRRKLGIIEKLNARKEKENLSDEVYEELKKKEFKALENKDSLSTMPSFKSWMNVCNKPIGKEHSGCDCCF